MASSSLTMEKATYARSTSGAKSAINNLQGDLDKVIKTLNGSKYTDFKKTVAKYWSGSDATRFLANVEVQRKSVEAQIKNLKSSISTAITNDKQQFDKFQNTTIPSVK